MFIGLTLDWIKNDMKEPPEELVDRLGKVVQNSFSDAIKRFQL